MIFCKHNYKIYNILHGDPINWFDGKRFWYRCTKCSKIIKIRNIKKESDWENNPLSGLIYIANCIIEKLEHENNIFNVDYNIWNW